MLSWIKRGLTSDTGGLWALVAAGVLAVNTAWGQGQGWVGQCDYATPYAITTIAGTPSPGGWADGTNEVAQFNWPQGLVVTTNRIVYIAEYLNNDVREMKPVGTNWVVTTIAGTATDSGSADGTNDTIQFNAPTSIAMDGAGNLYVTDGINDTIRKLTHVGTNWVSSTLAGTPDGGQGGFSDGTNGAARFNYPSGIAVDAATNVYVSDTYNSVIRLLKQVGTNWVVTTIAGQTNAGASFSDGTNQNALFAGPAGLAIDRAGHLFVGDTTNCVIREITPVGTNWVVTTIAGTGGNYDQYGVIDGTNGVATFNCPISSGPMAIAVDTNDNLYVADTGDSLVRKVSPQGTNWVTTTLAGLYNSPGGGEDGTGTNATFSELSGIAVDASGELFIADSLDNDIRLGVLAPATPPNLAVSRAGGTVIVWWVGAGFTLQTNASLASTNWGVFTNTVTTTGGTNSVTLSPPAGKLFFRLSD